MPAYYNEIDPFAAEWLQNLILLGHIAHGDVDTRSIEDVAPSDLKGYTQHHFFAGIGGWSQALRLAGWPDDRPVWTGSCPCQPFSAAGKGGGFADERHLWPAWFHLIEQCRPGVVFGEQVASKPGLAWLDIVQTDLEASGYAVGAVDLCAAGVGAPHIRQRLWFVADSAIQGRRAQPRRDGRKDGRPSAESRRLRDAGELADGDRKRLEKRTQQDRAENEREQQAPRRLDVGRRGVMGNPQHPRLQEQRGNAGVSREARATGEGQAAERAGAPAFWDACDWLPCRDGKARPVEPGAFPLAHGVPARVGKLRAYGNAIVPQAAAEVIRAYQECRKC